MENKPKVFDEFYRVNCNECARYWDSSCDGTNIEKPCNSYMATRDVVIPAQIEDLRVRVKLVAIALIVHLIGNIIGGLIRWLS